MPTKTFTKYSAWTYDIWGNEFGGFEVNDRHHLEDGIIIAEDAEEIEIKRLAKKVFNLQDDIAPESIIMFGDDQSIYFELDDPTALPIGEFIAT